MVGGDFQLDAGGQLHRLLGNVVSLSSCVLKVTGRFGRSPDKS